MRRDRGSEDLTVADPRYSRRLIKAMGGDTTERAGRLSARWTGSFPAGLHQCGGVSVSMNSTGSGLVGRARGAKRIDT